MKDTRVQKNIISSVLLQIITIICGFIVPRLIIESYGSSTNGLIVSITQFLAYITLFEAGVGQVVKAILYKPIANKEKTTIEEILKSTEKFFRIVAYIFIAYILGLCIILPLTVSKEFDVLYTISLIIIISTSTFVEYFLGMTYQLYLEAEQKKYVSSIINIVTLVLNTIFTIMLIHLGSSIQIVKLTTALVFVIRPILYNVYVKKKYKINLKDVKGKYIIKNKWDGLIQHIAYIVHTNTDVVVLALCTNMSEVSVYSVYSMIISGIKNLVQSFIGGVEATFGEMIAKNEQEKLNKSFNKFENYYFIIATIAFMATFILIVPFVKVYTNGITDANYIRPIFAYIIVIAEFIFVLRQPYNYLIKAAGHFKETRKGAFAETILNIVISLILVWRLGIIGVAIGTLIAMMIRTAEFMYHASKYILKRNVRYAYRKMLITLLEFVVAVLIYNFIPKADVTNYITWIVQAFIVTAISASVVILVNFFENRIEKTRIKKI